MGKAVRSDVLDAALAEIATATRLTLCSAEPTAGGGYAAISAVALADVSLTAGDGGGDFSIAEGDTDGRKVTVGAQSSFAIDASGTATHIALDDGTDIQFVTTCTAQALTAGGTVSVEAWDVEYSGTVINEAPAQPTISTSAVTTSGVTLTSSAYSDPEGDSHSASQWQITTAADTGFSSPVYDSGEDAVNLTQLVVDGVLSPDTDYIARVRHKD